MTDGANPTSSGRLENTLVEEREDLEWSAKQSRILTDNGNALRYYSSENGFPFELSELPHHHLEKGDSEIIFQEWARIVNKNQYSSPIVGAWDRPLFAGRWEHSTNEDEIVYNIQTRTLFVDLRVPRSKPVKRWESFWKDNTHYRLRDDDIREQVFKAMDGHDLRMFARQHVFGGFSVLSTMNESIGTHYPTVRPLLCCTRHHCIDWNYISGKPRPRPNKWYIDLHLSKKDQDFSATSTPTSVGKTLPPCNIWKELSYSTDENGQCYYYELWKRIHGDAKGEGLRLALRRERNSHLNVADFTDGIIVVVGDHFNYILGRKSTTENVDRLYHDASNLVELVDAAIELDDKEAAISYLSLDGGHGTVLSGWKIDCSIQPWNHGIKLFDIIGGDNAIKVVVENDGGNADFFSWIVTIGNSSWSIYESSIFNAQELEILLNRDDFQSRL